MYLALLILRTAVGVLTGALGWLLMSWLLPGLGPLLPAVVGGLVGGMVCVSLGPSIGHPLALTAGLVMTIVAFWLVWNDVDQQNWAIKYWPLWILPAYAAGAATWLVLARAIQNK